MNALTTIEAAQKPGLALAIPADQTFEQWVEMGRELAQAERRLGWFIGDWWEARQPAWGRQSEVAALNIWGASYSTLREYGAVARRFESGTRVPELTFGHHRQVAQLPDDEAMSMLRVAADKGLSTRDLRIEAMKRKVALGLFTPREDDDPDHTALVDIARRWNRAPRSVRETFLELASEADLGEIDP